MSQFDITVEGGTSVRLPTAGKYCDRDIVITAEGGGGGGDNFPIGDGNTHLWVSVPESDKKLTLAYCLVGSATIDWGDGSPSTQIAGASATAIKFSDNHEYEKSGDYVVTLTIDGTFYFTVSVVFSLGKGGYNALVLKKAEIGESFTEIGKAAFKSQYALNKIFIPDGVTSIGESAFYYAALCDGIRIPNSLNNIGKDAFDGVKYFGDLVFPEGVTSVPYQMLYNCCQASVTFLGDITSVDTYAFYGCGPCGFYDFTKCTAVPTLANTNAFANINKKSEIRVPAALVDEWKAATNWATYASYIVGV